MISLGYFWLLGSDIGPASRVWVQISLKLQVVFRIIALGVLDWRFVYLLVFFPWISQVLWARCRQL